MLITNCDDCPRSSKQLTLNLCFVHQLGCQLNMYFFLAFCSKYGHS